MIKSILQTDPTLNFGVFSYFIHPFLTEVDFRQVPVCLFYIKMSIMMTYIPHNLLKLVHQGMAEENTKLLFQHGNSMSK